MNIEEGFIPFLSLKKGLYAGNAIVKNHNGKAYMKVANILSIPIEIDKQKIPWRINWQIYLQHRKNMIAILYNYSRR